MGTLWGRSFDMSRQKLDHGGEDLGSGKKESVVTRGRTSSDNFTLRGRILMLYLRRPLGVKC